MSLKQRLIKMLGLTSEAQPTLAEPQPALEQKLNEGEFLLFRIGDCVSMHNIHGAIYDALRLCKDF